MATIILANDSETDYGTDSSRICRPHAPSGRRSKTLGSRIRDCVHGSPDSYQPRSQYCKVTALPRKFAAFPDDGKIILALSADGEYHAITPASLPAGFWDLRFELTALETAFQVLDARDREARYQVYGIMKAALDNFDPGLKESVISGTFAFPLSELQTVSAERSDLISNLKEGILASFLEKINCKLADSSDVEESAETSTGHEALATVTDTTQRPRL